MPNAVDIVGVGKDAPWVEYCWLHDDNSGLYELFIEVIPLHPLQLRCIILMHRTIINSIDRPSMGDDLLWLEGGRISRSKPMKTSTHFSLTPCTICNRQDFRFFCFHRVKSQLMSFQIWYLVGGHPSRNATFLDQYFSFVIVISLNQLQRFYLIQLFNLYDSF